MLFNIKYISSVKVLSASKQAMTVLIFSLSVDFCKSSPLTREKKRCAAAAETISTTALELEVFTRTHTHWSSFTVRNLSPSLCSEPDALPAPKKTSHTLKRTKPPEAPSPAQWSFCKRSDHHHQVHTHTRTHTRTHAHTHWHTEHTVARTRSLHKCIRPHLSVAGVIGILNMFPTFHRP